MVDEEGRKRNGGSELRIVLFTLPEDASEQDAIADHPR